MQERIEPPSVENLTEARRAIEAMLLVANDPTPVQLLAQLVELPVDLVQSMCRELAGEYESERRGFQLVEVAGGWRYQTHPDTHAYVERFALEGVPNRLSSAALETLAIVAYKQPISRAQVGAIRGVNVDGVLRTLVQRGYVDEQGRDDGPGQATLFGTTSFFLEALGLMALEDLPPLGDFVPSVEVLEALENTLRVDPEPEPVVVDDEISVADDGITVVDDQPAESIPSAEPSQSAEVDGERGQPEGDDPATMETAVESVNGTNGDSAVYEVLGDPADLVIPIETPEPGPAEPEPPTSAEDEDENEAEDEVTIEAGTDEAHGVPLPEPLLRIEPEATHTDELEVTADPEVEMMTDGTTETGAAGVDDARFPGPGPSPSADPALDGDQGEEPAGGLGQGPSTAPHRGDQIPDRPPSWPETMSNGNGHGQTNGNGRANGQGSGDA